MCGDVNGARCVHLPPDGGASGHERNAGFVSSTPETMTWVCEGCEGGPYARSQSIASRFCPLSLTYSSFPTSANFALMSAMPICWSLSFAV